MTTATTQTSAAIREAVQHARRAVAALPAHEEHDTAREGVWLGALAAAAGIVLLTGVLLWPSSQEPELVYAPQLYATTDVQPASRDASHNDARAASAWSYGASGPVTKGGGGHRSYGKRHARTCPDPGDLTASVRENTGLGMLSYLQHRGASDAACGKPSR